MKQLLLFCFAFASLAGCKKKSDPPPPFQSYLRMTVDGTRTITADMNMRASTPRNPASLSISGRWPTGSLTIEILTYDNILGEKFVSSNLGTSPRFSLYDPSPTLYYAGDAGIYNAVRGSGKINVLEINNEYVKGTFEFTTAIYNTNPQIRTVTNGEFHVKRYP